MSDDYKVQVSTTILGDLWVFRGESGSEVRQNIDDSIEDVTESLNALKQAVLAKGVQTGNATGGYGGSKPASGGGGQKSSGGYSKDNPPKCDHGEMKWLGDKNYKNTWYCTEKNRDRQCKPLP